MNQLFITLLLFFIRLVTSGQPSCIKHWSIDSVPRHQLDSILAGISFPKTDSLRCNSYTIPEELDSKWYIDFYNTQLGNYFSESRCVNIGKRYYKERRDALYDEIIIIQFELPQEKLMLFKNKFGEVSQGYGYFKLKVFTLYQHVIKDNSIYFISTESYHPGKADSFLDKVFDVIIRYK